MSFTLVPHTGLRAIHNSEGNPVRNVEVDTGMKRIYWEEAGSKQQIGFLHPNGFLHFIIPDPPDEFKEEVKEAVERMTAAPITRMGSPPPIAAVEEGPSDD